MGYQKNEERLYIFFAVPIINISTTFICLDKIQIQQSHCLLVPVIFIEQFPFCLALNILSHFHYAISQVTSFYCQLDYIGIVRQLYCFIVIYCFHHVATQDPGHSTKFVMLPSSILLQ